MAKVTRGKSTTEPVRSLGSEPNMDLDLGTDEPDLSPKLGLAPSFNKLATLLYFYSASV